MPIQVPQRPPVRQTGRTQTLDFYPLVTQRRGRMSRIMALTLAAALFASTSSALADWHGHGGGYHGGGWHGGHDHHGGCGWCWGLGLGGLALGLGTLYAAPPVYYAPPPAYYPPPGYAPGYAYPPPRLRSRPPRLGPRSGRWPAKPPGRYFSDVALTGRQIRSRVTLTLPAAPLTSEYVG